VFSTDVVYDLTAFGHTSLHGLTAVNEATLALGEAHPVGHHVTNVVLTEVTDSEVRARSKGIGVNADGTTGSVTYDDTISRGAEGWRISRRGVVPHRRPLGAR
jgi:hypothetical protein